MMAVIVAAIIAMVLALAVWPVYPGIGGALGVTYWTFLTLVASAFPVMMPRGTLVSVSIAPILAGAALGGPAAAAVIAAFGTTEWRELRGRIPWYGTLYNHAALVLPAVLAALVYGVVAGAGFSPDLRSFGGLVLAGLAYFAVNALLASTLAALRLGLRISSVLMSDVRMVSGSLLGMAPLAWLMALGWHFVWWSTLLFALPLYTTRAAYQQVVELRRMFTQTVRALATAIDARDPYTKLHSDNVQQICLDVGRLMHCSEAQLEALEWGALLHDIGKIGIGDAVLLKPDKLNREERILMNDHPAVGEEIIRPVDRLQAELPLIRHHHEWYNGSGYPDHLVGEAIPKLARIIHVADAWEAMTAARPYRMIPLTAEEALGELRKFAGIQFDPAVVDAFAQTDWVAGVPDAAAPPPRPKPVPLFRRAAAIASRRGRGGNGHTPDAG
jgi:hypothetical protein